MAFKLVSLFTGAGGINYGFEAAGFDVYAANEMDRDCCLTLAANRDWPVIEGDIHDVSSDELMGVGGLKPGDADVLVGGPPCQPFSKSSYWVSGRARRMEDPRARTLFEYMRCVEDVLPKVFLLENVRGINYSGKEEGFLVLRSLTEQINKEKGTDYTLSWAVLDTADYGVPQSRKRFFLVGHRDGGKFQFPMPTHYGPDSREPPLFKAQPHVAAWDAIGDCEVDPKEDLAAKGYWGDLLPSIPEGENYLWHTDRKGGLPLFGWRTRFWSFLLKLAKARPSWTIQAQPGPAIGPFHWESRRLSVEEMARLQTFPRNLNYAGSRSSLQRQLGNAVPSLMAEILAREIAIQFLGAEYTALPKLSVHANGPAPDSEPVDSVPEKYLEHAGEHAPHPGTGKGRAALRRAARDQGSLDESDAAQL